MNRFLTLVSAAAVLTLVADGALAGSAECKSDRPTFELLVSLRMLTYASMGDPWSPRASQWAQEIAANGKAGRTTSLLDGAYQRFRRYCDGGDDFMAGLTLGEWIGLALRKP